MTRVTSYYPPAAWDVKPDFGGYLSLGNEIRCGCAFLNPPSLRDLIGFLFIAALTQSPFSVTIP